MKKFCAIGAAIAAAIGLAACGSTHTGFHPKPHFTAPPPTSCVAPQVLHGGVCRDPQIFAPPSASRSFAPRSTGLLYGYDAVTLSYIPSSAAVVGCYVDGYVNCPQARADFPRAHIVSYSIRGNPADCLDVEPGAAQLSQIVGWTRYMDAHRSLINISAPCIYAAGSWMPQVVSLLNNAGLHHETDYLLTEAAWDGVANVPYGFDAHQYASNCCVDNDVWGSWFFHRTPPPPPKPVYNWDWFQHTPPAAGNTGPSANVPFNEHGQERRDVNGERSIYHLYVTARAKDQTGERVAYVAELKEEAHGLANNITNEMEHASRAYNIAHHRFGRRAVFVMIYEGQPHVTWDRAQDYAKSHAYSRR